MSDAIREFVYLCDKWSTRFEARIADLTDDELWWEPVPDCWHIYRDGSGGDFGLIFTEEAPFTTLGWRMAHIIDLLKEDRCATYLGLEPEPSAAEEWIPTSAEQARTMVRDATATFRRYIEATDPDALGEKVPMVRDGHRPSRFQFILHILDEVIHHGAEVGLLRDLWRAQQPRDEFAAALLRADASAAADTDAVAQAKQRRPDLVVEAAATGRWQAVPLLVELGFPLEGSTGRSVLHHAAAKGDVDLVRLLVERGARLDAKDPIYNAEPKVWAQFFNRGDVADYLARVGSRADGQ